MVEENEENSPDESEELDFQDDYDPNAAYLPQLEEFTKVKEILDRNDRFGHFSVDVARILDSWKATHRREEYFVNQWRKLKCQLQDCQTGLQASEHQRNLNEISIAKLKDELTSAWRQVDEAHSREQRTQEVIDSLRAQVTKLSQELDLNKKMGGDQENEAGTLAKNREMLMKEKERMMAELLVAKGKLAKAQKINKELEETNEEAERKIAERATELEALKNELAKEKRFKEKLESDLSAVNEAVADKDKEVANQMNLVQNLMKNVAKLEQTIKEQKNNIDKLNKELAEALSAQKVTKAELEHQHANVARLTSDLATKMHDLKVKEDECQKLKLDEQKIRKIKENLQKRVEILDGQKAEIEEDKSKLLSAKALLEKEINELKKQIISDKKIIEALNRERELVAKAAKKTSAVTAEQQAIITLNEVEKKRQAEEISDLQSQVSKLQKDVKSALADKEVVTNELTHLKRKVLELEELVKLREGQIEESQKNLSEVEGKMKLHVNLFEQVRTERNKVSKRLVEAEDEISDLTHKLKVKSYEVEQLKEDMTTKENMLVKGEFNLQKVTKEKESLRLERQKMSNELKELKDKLQILGQEEKRLQKIVDETDDDRQRLLKELEQASKERDSNLSQLKMKMEETGKLEGKIILLEDTLKKGEAQYQQRIDDIRLLKVEIKRLRQEKALITRHMGNAVELRREMFHLERDYTRERLKCRALQDELTNPLNVHRWRKLEGSDPETFELINKVQLLQKRLIGTSEEAMKREAQLMEAENKIKDLEAALSRQTQKELSGKIHTLSVAVREKSTRIRILEAELSAFEKQASEYKIALDHKDEEIAQIKRKYFAFKRREQKIREKENDLDRSKLFLPAIIGGSPAGKYVGGGFNLGPPQQKMSV